MASLVRNSNLRNVKEEALRIINVVVSSDAGDGGGSGAGRVNR